MAAGDAYITAVTSVNAAAYLDIQPAAGQEIVVHNVFHSDAVEFYIYDGSNSILFDADSTSGVWSIGSFPCTSSRYLRVKNVAAAAQNIAASGRTTKGGA